MVRFYSAKCVTVIWSGKLGENILWKSTWNGILRVKNNNENSKRSVETGNRIYQLYFQDYQIIISQGFFLFQGIQGPKERLFVIWEFQEQRFLKINWSDLVASLCQAKLICENERKYKTNIFVYLYIKFVFIFCIREKTTHQKATRQDIQF